MITATRIIRNAPAPFDGEIALDYEGRLLRRKKLASGTGDFLVDLPEVTSVEDGDAFQGLDFRQQSEGQVRLVEAQGQLLRRA